MKLNNNPNSNQLAEIKTWLIEENEKNNEGFYCNWKIIEDSSSKKRLITFEVEKETIGFISWATNGEPYAEIDIMEIHPNHRQKGYGRLFFDKAEEFFKLQNFIAIKLFCDPTESESFWKKMKFIKFPETGFSEPELTYYKPLIKTNEPIEQGTENKLELWELEPYEIKEQKPKWTWEIGNKKHPILQPCNSDWNLRLTKNGIIIKEEKVKYFEKSKEIEVGPFLYIETID